jgi:hypothetical protein
MPSDANPKNASQSRTRKPIEIPLVFAPVYIPLFLVAAAASVPVAHIGKLVQRRREKQFARQVQKADRLMT